LAVKAVIEVWRKNYFILKLDQDKYKLLIIFGVIFQLFWIYNFLGYYNSKGVIFKDCNTKVIKAILDHVSKNIYSFTDIIWLINNFLWKIPFSFSVKFNF